MAFHGARGDDEPGAGADLDHFKAVDNDGRADGRAGVMPEHERLRERHIERLGAGGVGRGRW